MKQAITWTSIDLVLWLHMLSQWYIQVEKYGCHHEGNIFFFSWKYLKFGKIQFKSYV